MSSAKTYLSPNGVAIIGTSDHVFVTARIKGIWEDGTPEYEGGSDIHWDTQESAHGDDIVFVDDDGNGWTFRQLVPQEESDASE